jgi:pantoate--beta-alanine ligase
MILFKKTVELKAYLAKHVYPGTTTGFVPTMGALHQGHLSLVRASKDATALTVCSIFVNPTQFNDPKDFQKYPVTLEQDIYLLEKQGADILFLPGVSEVYPQGTARLEHYELGYLETILEGKYRPGHFQGVCQVMGRLIDIVEPGHLFMGQKDYQQCMVIKKMLADKKSTTVFDTCPTLREPDGLAMSSRNMRLNDAERKNAAAIYQSLSYIKSNLREGSLMDITAKAKDILAKYDFKTDYVEIADASTLEILDEWDGKKQLVALVAAFQHETRLIDNMVVGDEHNLK